MSIYIDGRDCCQTGQFSQDVADGALTVLADNPELILRVLQLRFDESLSYPRISAQTGVSKTAIFSLVRRFHQVFTDWPISGDRIDVFLSSAFLHNVCLFAIACSEFAVGKLCCTD